MTWVEVHLPYKDVVAAITVGTLRQLENLYKKLTDHHGANSDDRGWDYHITGALGEQAIAKYLDRYWSGADKIRAHDVGPFEVRASAWHGMALRLHKRDHDATPYVLVTGKPGAAWRIHGWLYGHEGKVEHYWGDKFKKNRPAYFIPQDELHPMSELPRN